MSREHDMELMRLHDDELTDEQRDAIEAALDDRDAGVLEGLSQLGEVLRVHSDARGAAGADIADSVMAALEAQADKPAPKPRVLSLPPRAENSRRGLVAGGLALAAAAAVAFGVTQFAAPDAAPPPEVAETPRRVVDPGVLRPVAPAVVAEPAVPAAIESIDFGTRNGAIFMVSAGEETTPVVWMTDDAAEGGDRMEPL